MALLGRLIPTTHVLLWTESLACTACGEHREKPTVSSYSEAHKLTFNLSGKPGNWDDMPQLSKEGLLRRRTFESMDARASLEEIAHKLAGNTVVRRFFFAEVWNILGVSRVHPPVPTPLEETS